MYAYYNKNDNLEINKKFGVKKYIFIILKIKSLKKVKLTKQKKCVFIENPGVKLKIIKIAKKIKLSLCNR